MLGSISSFLSSNLLSVFVVLALVGVGAAVWLIRRGAAARQRNFGLTRGGGSSELPDRHPQRGGSLDQSDGPRQS